VNGSLDSCTLNLGRNTARLKVSIVLDIVPEFLNVIHRHTEVVSFYLQHKGASLAKCEVEM
jgi:hypothetical protein